MEDYLDDPPQNKLLKDRGNLLVNPDPGAKMMNQANRTTTQSKKDGIEITILLQQISQEQDWGDLIEKGLAEAAKNLWHANIAKDKFKDYMENDKIPSKCTFLSVPKMNSEIFCQIPSQAKGKFKDYMENDKIPSKCTFLSVPKMNSEIFCQIPSQAKGHDVKLQKQLTLLSMASLKLVQILDSLKVIKKSENLHL